MAEIVCKVGSVVPGDHTTYQDGDILDAFNDDRIHCVHAQTICFPRVNGQRPVEHTGHRLDPMGLSQFYFDQVSQYRFERVSPTEVKRTLLADMSEEVFSDRPNIRGERIDVKAYVARRLAHCRATTNGGKAIFGTPGAEVWYGGTTDTSRPTLTAIWDEIERVTASRKRDHGRYPGLDFRKHLVLLVDDFTAEEGATLTSPILTKKRSRMVDIDAQLNAVDRTTTRNPLLEARVRQIFQRSRVVEIKA